MLVVKLGGSLFNSPDLRRWLAALSQPSEESIVIVPGGGPFADQVRTAQKTWGFDDHCAHRMAVHAMEQFGEMLCGLAPALKLVSNLQDINEAILKKAHVIWAPCQMISENASIIPDWSTSSDSLAVWLAKEIRADHLVLVKSIDLEPGHYSVAQLQACLCVDKGFGGVLAGSTFECWIAHASQSARLARVRFDEDHWPIKILKTDSRTAIDASSPA